ncbi:MAG TPA: hypothetical protein VEK08_22925 [Planctomycetota bacterium]|nr:hypothetical protein [Planctomycetota bacterium]
MPLCKLERSSHFHKAFAPGWYQSMPSREKAFFRVLDCWATWFVSRDGSSVVLPAFCITLKEHLQKVDAEYRTGLHLSLCNLLDEMIEDADFVRLDSKDRFNRMMFEYFLVVESALPLEAHWTLNALRQTVGWK